MALEVNLAEGRGLVATEEIARGEAVLGVNRGTITVRRALEEAKLGPRHAELQEWSIWRRFGAAGVGVGAWGGGDVWGIHSCVAETTRERVRLAGG